MKTIDLTQTIFLDIETKPSSEPMPSLVKVDGRLKDPQKIAEDALRKSMLDPCVGQIFCIGLAVDDGDVFTLNHDREEDLMLSFDEWLSNYSFPKIVGHNIIDFDGHWLFVKGLRYGLKNVIANFMDSSRLVDTMKAMDGPAWKKMVSQNRMSYALLGNPGKGDMDGSMVYDALVEGRMREVVEYCIHDVTVLRQCYRKLHEHGLC